MEKAEILQWEERYNKEEDHYNTGIEKELGDKFRKNKEVTKEDLLKIIEWKFQGRLIGRRKRFLGMLQDLDAAFYQKLSSLAFETDSELYRIKLLSLPKGNGISVASVILSFYDPKNYGVFDIHVWRELFGKEPKDMFTNIKHYLRFLEKLREISKETDLDVRFIEKALFKKNLEGEDPNNKKLNKFQGK